MHKALVRSGPIEVEIDVALGVVTIVSLADPTIAEWKTMIETVLSHPAFRPGFGFLSDRRRVPVAASAEFVREAARQLAQHPAVVARARWAVLNDGPVGYGMARIGRAYLLETGPEVGIFRDAGEALAWLRAGRTDERRPLAMVPVGSVG